ncbi:MAG: cupin domain-containing protein [Patescibacteria group bacterium]
MSTKKVGNGKYYSGKYADAETTKGWFVGSFFPEGDARKTGQIEMFYTEHRKGDVQPAHHHEKKVELLIFLEGQAEYRVNDTKIVLNSGDFLFVDVNNVISGEFLAPTKFFAIHSPSIPTDKVDD